MTLLNDPRPISADSHALEGPEVFEGLPERFGDDAPRVVHKEGAGDFITIPNQPPSETSASVIDSGNILCIHFHMIEVMHHSVYIPPETTF